MQKKLIECVPNFSEGRDLAVIKQITDVIEKVEGIKLLDVDPGEATNRTVVTFVGEPEQVMVRTMHLVFVSAVNIKSAVSILRCTSVVVGMAIQMQHLASKKSMPTTSTKTKSAQWSSSLVSQ